MRIGHGYDVHAFGGNKPLILGGVSIENHPGLIAHSDGDVVLHAVCDALLGAAGLGDIGFHFPDNSQQYAGADSRQLLKHVVSLLQEKKYKIGNLDVTIIAQTPKMAPHIKDMKNNIAKDIDVKVDFVNLKATTTEKLGYIGRKEGIAVHCVCLLDEQINAGNN